MQIRFGLLTANLSGDIQSSFCYCSKESNAKELAMLKELDLPRTELYPLARDLARVFVMRSDIYPRQMDDGSYVCIRKPLKEWHLASHLEGRITLGSYALNVDSQARFIVFDADDKHEFTKLVVMAKRLAREGVPSYLETSRRGGHLWLFFSQTIPGSQARGFGTGLGIVYGLGDMELFPKQTQLKSGPGSLVRLPFGVHQKTGQRYGFITPDGLPLAETLNDQIHLLSAPKTVPIGAIAYYRNTASKQPQKAEIKPAEAPSGTLSERIKASVTVMDFVGQYVELSSNGRGLCPFHDDQRSSFSVNVEQNYWSCFAGCGGGSIIDFWMKWRKCEFKIAVRELANKLL
jgi:hypothetical protein